MGKAHGVHEPCFAHSCVARVEKAYSSAYVCHLEETLYSEYTAASGGHICPTS